jgi:DNA mismatch repair protein MutL
LVTGVTGDTAGTRLVLDGGVWGPIEDAANPGGTEVRVRRLFFNTPVRLKFLRTPRTEMHHVLDTVRRMALSHPRMALKLISDGRAVLDVPRDQELSERVRKVLGKATQEGMVQLAARQGDLRLEGLVSGPRLHRSNRAGVFLFVNGRFVRDRTVVGALISGYREVLPKGRYPVAVLFLDLPPGSVDVNVHPAKVEVRFEDSAEIWRFVGSAVSELLAKLARGGTRQEGLFAEDGEVTPSLPTLLRPPSSGPILEFRDPATERAARAIAQARPAASGSSDRRLLLDPLGLAAAPPPPLGSPPPAALWRARLARRSASEFPWGEQGRPDFARGSLQGRFGRWILWSLEQDLLLVDPVAAHCRLVFSTLRQGSDLSALESRRLLVPELFETAAAAVSSLLNCADDLGRRGLEISDFGGGSLALHAGPLGLEPSRLKMALDSLVQRDMEAGGLAEDDLLYELDAQLSWYSGPGEDLPLAPDTQIALVTQLDTVEQAFACPFGRPTYARLSRSEAERWFRAGK